METAETYDRYRSLVGSAAITALFAAYSAYPAARIVGRFFEADVSLFSFPISALILFLCSASAAAVSFRAGEAKRKPVRVFAAVLPGLSFFNIWLFLEGFSDGEPILNLLTSLLMFLGTAGCVIIRIRALYSGRIRHWSWIVPLAVSAPLGFMCLIVGTFGSIGKDTTVESRVSPDGRHIAELVDSDEGALGGSTLVTVKRNIDGGFLIFRWTGIGSVVYSGEWGEWDDMDIEWRDDETLSIDGKDYKIS